MDRETYIIYCYREIDSPNRCKVGIKLYRQNKQRQLAHRGGYSGCLKFDRFVKARFKEGKRFDDIFEYFELETFIGNRQDAESREDHYTKLWNAIDNGFCLQSGCYNGSASQETKEKQSRAAKGRKSPMDGKRHTEESNQKNRESHLGKKLGPRPEQVKRKISLTKTGSTHKDSTKRKMSVSQTIRRWRERTETCRTNFELSWLPVQK